jgi:hypothetical protein
METANVGIEYRRAQRTSHMLSVSGPIIAIFVRWALAQTFGAKTCPSVKSLLLSNPSETDWHKIYVAPVKVMLQRRYALQNDMFLM